MIAIIPARGGSKGVPNKNIKEINGKPLIAYTIECALASKKLDRIICSTDSDIIAEIAIKYGAEVPFMRPAELAQDNSIATDTYLYTIDRLNADSNRKHEAFVILHPTSPLRLPVDIDSAIELFFTKGADSIISCFKMSHPPHWTLKIDENGTLKKFYDFDVSGKNRQEIDDTFFPNGAVTVLNYLFLKEMRTYYSDKTFAYIMPQERSIDIDTEHDFKVAELLIEQTL
jgi:CMP-N,N'-diacetyllegionaminic acid synthase